ncbi:hypothetical protein K1719_034971 [Acacia pycnantha]|nr:hypothetical protein K1719_034971 [Acacia pycnantha]
MRFLLEFAYYCGCAPLRSPVPATSSSSSSSRYSRRRGSFAAPLPPPSHRPRHVLKRRRLGAPGQWRPKLLTISEDVDDVDEVAMRLTTQSKRMSHASQALHYDYDSRRTGSSRILTAFYPIPYMF